MTLASSFRQMSNCCFTYWWKKIAFLCSVFLTLVDSIVFVDFNTLNAIDSMYEVTQYKKIVNFYTNLHILPKN